MGRLPGWGALAIAVIALAACSGDGGAHPHGAIAPDIMAPLGDPAPYATAEQLETFTAGRQVALRRFGVGDGLGPAFNVTSCAACHERPVTGGSAGLYRNFFLAGTSLEDGSFVEAESAGPSGGAVRVYSFASGLPARPAVPADVNVVAQRNPIPFFGVGLLAEIDDAEILKREDPDDRDGDGISGRANYDRGFVGRFGRKAQTVSIEKFIRGPLFNHLGITTEPLSEAQKAALPVDSSLESFDAAAFAPLLEVAQAAAPDGPLTDDDGAADPELGGDDLFDLVSFAMLLAVPEFEEPGDQAIRGAAVFDASGCGSCHTPRLDGPRGPVPAYSDLLLHDMGEELADGISMGDATGSEFRTQPLWGLAAVGPYLHDGRAATITDAILLHGGEAAAARDEVAALSPGDLDDLVEFLLSLGGRSQFSSGLIPAGTPPAAVGEFGGPVRALSAAEGARFVAGRDAFDRDFSFADGVGSPVFNGDSCRACHFDPVAGGSGPADVNVMRHGSVAGGGFVAPAGGTILHKETAMFDALVAAPAGTSVFEHRQTPALFGLGLVDALDAEVIVANADPDDADGDGISGRAAYLEDGRLGRFGWKAQVPSLMEFVRDAVAAEMGMTMDPRSDATFGITDDADDVADPEMRAADADAIEFFLALLGPPPRGDAASTVAGERLFADIGCSSCHIPALEGPQGPVALYSDLLLHEVAAAGTPGIPDGPAGPTEFRTPPLWGLRHSGPYLHDGSADTIDEAVRRHDGEAAASRDRYVALSANEIDEITAFLESL